VRQETGTWRAAKRLQSCDPRPSGPYICTPRGDPTQRGPTYVPLEETPPFTDVW
jgi:hypothetical protein